VKLKLLLASMQSEECFDLSGIRMFVDTGGFKLLPFGPYRA
jgi:hypothetical protein